MPTSKNYPEMRERLRLRLKKKVFNSVFRLIFEICRDPFTVFKVLKEKHESIKLFHILTAHIQNEFFEEKIM